jgi:hypothetical protein
MPKSFIKNFNDCFFGFPTTKGKIESLINKNFKTQSFNVHLLELSTRKTCRM